MTVVCENYLYPYTKFGVSMYLDERQHERTVQQSFERSTDALVAMDHQARCAFARVVTQDCASSVAVLGSSADSAPRYDV
jgi:hypothetical protein